MNSVVFSLILGTATPGGGFPVFGAAYAEMLNAQEPRLRIVDNPTGLTPHGLNAAIAAARHDILVRVDGHAFLPPGYVREVVDVLQRTGAANVGGRMLPEGDSPVSSAITMATIQRLGRSSAARTIASSSAGKAIIRSVKRISALPITPRM